MKKYQDEWRQLPANKYSVGEWHELIQSMPEQWSYQKGRLLRLYPPTDFILALAEENIPFTDFDTIRAQFLHETRSIFTKIEEAMHSLADKKIPTAHPRLKKLLNLLLKYQPNGLNECINLFHFSPEDNISTPVVI